MTENFIADGEIRILNERMAYCLKYYDNDAPMVLHEEAELMAEKYIEYVNFVNPKQLQENYKQSMLSGFFPCPYWLDAKPQIIWKPPHTDGSLAQKASLCMKFFRLINDELFFQRPKKYAGVLPDHPTSTRTTNDIDAT